MIRFNKPTIGRKDLESVLYCMIEDDLTPGKHLKCFISLLQKRLGLSNVTAFNNYYSVFEAIFHYLGAESNDEVILPSFARYSILRALLRCGLKPVLVDLEEDSLMPSLENIKERITKRTKCIVLAHLFGIPCHFDRYRECGIPLIEDLDGSLGSTIDGKPAGSFGDFITLNFTDDSMVTTGNGGMLGSPDRGLKEALKAEEFLEQIMSDFNASLGISQLNKLEENIEKRRKIGEYYDDAVMAGNCSFIGRDEQKQLCFSSFIVRTKTPFEGAAQFFKRYGIPIRRGLEKPLHRYLALDAQSFKNTEAIYHEIVALPIYPELRKADIESIAKGIRSVL